MFCASRKLALRWLAYSLFLAAVFPALADTIFDNSVNDLGTRFNPGILEVGDEIILAGSARYLTSFTFEFWGINTASPGSVTFAGKVEARVRFYLNDGPPYHGYATPGTSLYDSGWFVVPRPTLRNTFVFVAGSEFPIGGLFLPKSDMTWSVQFQGMAATDSVGLDLFSPPVVGMDFSDYWQRDSGGWTLRTLGGVTSTDFAAKMQATVGAAPSPPVLQIVETRPLAVLSWPLWASNYVLETSCTLTRGASWSPLTNGVTISGGYYFLTNEANASSGFYRLHAQQ